MAEQRIRWYVLRIERYVRGHPEKSVKEHEPDEVRAYLEKAGRDPGPPGWLFRQLVDALQILHCDVIGLEWSRTFDWKYWLDSARELKSRHPTLARYNHPAASRKPPSEDIEPTERCSSSARLVQADFLNFTISYFLSPIFRSGLRNRALLYSA